MLLLLSKMCWFLKSNVVIVVIVVVVVIVIVVVVDIMFVCRKA